VHWRWAGAAGGSGAALPVRLVGVGQSHKLVGCRLQACYSSEDRAAGHELPVVATALSTWDACAALQRMEPAILPSSDAKIRRCKARRPTQLRAASQGWLVERSHRDSMTCSVGLHSVLRDWRLSTTVSRISCSFGLGGERQVSRKLGLGWRAQSSATACGEAADSSLPYRSCSASTSRRRACSKR